MQVVGYIYIYRERERGEREREREGQSVEEICGHNTA